MWELAISTADVPGVSTDADIGVIILSDNGQSPERGLMWTLENPGDDLEQGQADIYLINPGPVGVPHTIQLWFNPAAGSDSPNWHCDAMKLLGPGDVNIFFPVNREFTERGWYTLASAVEMQRAKFRDYDGRTLVAAKKVSAGRGTAPPSQA